MVAMTIWILPICISKSILHWKNMLKKSPNTTTLKYQSIHIKKLTLMSNTSTLSNNGIWYTINMLKYLTFKSTWSNNLTLFFFKF